MPINLTPVISSFEIPGRVTFGHGRGGLVKVLVATEWSTAELYLHGAHVTSFQRNGADPVLFLSEQAEFSPGKAIRGGIPIIFPWFGGRQGFPSHGFARTTEWELSETKLLDDGRVLIRLLLPPTDSGCLVEYTIMVGEALSLELRVANLGKEEFTFEGCLHTYFQVGSIEGVSIGGLNGLTYIDQLDGNLARQEVDPEIRISAEVDRIYQGASMPVEIQDSVFQRTIRITTEGCQSAVVWNPWIEKSERMSDFGNAEYLQMVCVESGNIAGEKIHLTPGGESHVRIQIETAISA